LASSAGKQYLGAAAEINLQNPQVTDNQFSQAFVQIKSGPGVEVNTIQFGWMVIHRHLLLLYEYFRAIISHSLSNI
jgi:hypothetical protein